MPWQKPLGLGSFLDAEILAYQNLHQLVTVDLADHGAGIFVIGDVGGVFGQKISDDLIDGVVAFLVQSVEHSAEYLAHTGLVIAGNCEFQGAFIRHWDRPP